MQPHPRYDVQEQMAAGDFATVYRALDRELNREVAIKQIHPQFLADQNQLERYWQEAQLLASLEHPNIMTIYDIVRDRGWLVLELMQGNLSVASAGQPMDLNFLRVTLVCCLKALQFLHANGIVHGDVKPSNLLLDKRNHVKLGDFGLAQRVTNDQGSLLKGTTKYMAPERVSDQFGPVGQSSDLYSLGFSLYELMCGAEHFDTLFPGLGAFGRDQQIAWMMWHSAADRRLPEIPRVLEGVPPDLAEVIQKLCQKDPAQRYLTADEAIEDLRVGMGISPPPPEGPTEEELAEEAARKKKKQRLMIGGALVFSLIVCVAALLLPGPGNGQAKPPQAIREVAGSVHQVAPAANMLVLQVPGEARPAEILLRPNDQVLINGELAKLDALKEGDRVQVDIDKSGPGKSLQVVRVVRPAMHEGTVHSIDGPRELTISARLGDGRIKQIPLTVPAKVQIRLNGQTRQRGQPITVGMLQQNDQIAVDHDGDFGERRLASRVDARRGVKVQGVLRGYNAARKSLTYELTEGGESETFPLAEQVEISLNGKKFADGKPIAAGDLRPGDLVTVTHDTRIDRVDAFRVIRKQGVVTQIDPRAPSITVKLSDGAEVNYLPAAEATIRLGDETVTLDELRPGDTVRITTDALDTQNSEVQSIDAARVANRRLWSLIIAIGNHADDNLSKLQTAEQDARLVNRVMTTRYRVPADQAMLLLDLRGSLLQEEMDRFLRRVPADGQLVVYVVGHVFVRQGTPYFAAQDFDFYRIAESGVPLELIIKAVEQSKAKEKMLVLDTAHAGRGADLTLQPSAEEQVELIEDAADTPVIRDAIVVVGTKQGERGQPWRDGESGRLAHFLSEAYLGAADTNKDQTVSAAEAFDFLRRQMQAVGGDPQTPSLIEPRKVIPPRLSAAVIEALDLLALQVNRAEIDPEALQAAYARADQLAADQPEPKLLAAIAELKQKKYPAALKLFQQARGVAKANPTAQWVPLEGMIWSLYQQRQYGYGVRGLERLVGSLPASAAGAPLPNEVATLLEWSGRLREYAVTEAPPAARLTIAQVRALDESVRKRGEASMVAYDKGRKAVDEVSADFDRQIARAETDAQRLSLKQLVRPRLANYVDWSEQDAVRRVIAGTKAQ